MSFSFSSSNLIEVHQDLFRNIVSLRESEDLFDDLSDDPNAWQAAQKLEFETKPRFFTSPTPAIYRPFEEAEWNTAIGYPFTELSVTRFSDGSFGVWYGADELETTIYETVHHWKNGLLADAGFSQSGIEIQRRVYKVRCDAALIDLRASIRDYPNLVHSTDYSLTHEIGARIHREGHPGLITKSARGGGDVEAVFNPEVLSNPQHHCYLTYITTSSGIEIQREKGTVLLRI